MGELFIDLDKLVERMEGDTDLIREIFSVFIEEVPVRREKFTKALAAMDFETLTLLAHSLKGASGTLHAEPLRQICYDLEQAARASNTDKVMNFVPRVLELLGLTADKMGELLKDRL